jgi:hypothetical protein
MGYRVPHEEPAKNLPDRADRLVRDGFLRPDQVDIWLKAQLWAMGAPKPALKVIQSGRA